MNQGHHAASEDDQLPPPEVMLELVCHRRRQARLLEERIEELLSLRSRRQRRASAGEITERIVRRLRGTAVEDVPDRIARRPRQGFTLIELLVVIAIIAALAGMTFAGVFALFRAKQDEAAQALLIDVVAVINSEGRQTVTVPDGDADPDNDPSYRLWDFDGDGELDGKPELDFEEPHRSAAEQVGYRGFAISAEWSQTRQIDRRGRILDPWSRPLRIRFHPSDYGSVGFGVWSVGRDGKDGTDDDITSWQAQ